MKLDIILKTRTFSDDYSWISVKNYISEETIKKLDDFIGNIYINEEFRDIVKKSGKYIFYIFESDKSLILSRITYSSNLDMAGRNIYSFEGFSVDVSKKDDLEEFLSNIPVIIYSLIHSKKILRDTLIKNDDNVVDKTAIDIEIIKSKNYNENMIIKSPYEYLNYKIKEGIEKNQHINLMLSSQNIDISELDIDEVIDLNKNCYEIPKKDKKKEEVKKKSLDVNNERYNSVMPSSIIEFFNTNFKYEDDLELDFKNNFYGLCVFNVYKSNMKYEYKIKLVEYRNRDNVIFETVATPIPFYGISIKDMMKSMEKFLSLISKYGFEQEIGLLVKYPNCNLNLNNESPILIDENLNNTEITKGVYYAVPPVVNIKYIMSEYKRVFRKSSYKENMKLKLNYKNNKMKKNSNILLNIFNKKNNCNNEIRYRSLKWTNVMY